MVSWTEWSGDWAKLGQLVTTSVSSWVSSCAMSRWQSFRGLRTPFYTPDLRFFSPTLFHNFPWVFQRRQWSRHPDLLQTLSSHFFSSIGLLSIYYWQPSLSERKILCCCLRAALMYECKHNMEKAVWHHIPSGKPIVTCCFLRQMIFLAMGSWLSLQ